MEEFAEVVSGSDSRGGECVEWPCSELSEALRVIKMNTSTTPKELWDESTLIYTPFVPSSLVTRRPSTNPRDKFADSRFPFPNTDDAELFYVMHTRPVVVVQREILLPNPRAVNRYREAARKAKLPLLPFHVLSEDASAQKVLEAERIVEKIAGPFAPPHLEIGARVLVQGLKQASFVGYNGQMATLLVRRWVSRGLIGEDSFGLTSNDWGYHER
jgi:hypothetical protein